MTDELFDFSDYERQAQDIINKLRKRLEQINFSRVFPQIREVVQNSISRNFSEGGRYGNDNPWGGGSTKWEKSQRANKQKGQTLVDTSALRKSIQVSVKQVGFSIEIGISSNLPYAALHHFGFDGSMNIAAHTRIMSFKKYSRGKNAGKTRIVKAKKATSQMKASVKAHSRDVHIPARPFLVLQNEDLEEIIGIIKNFIVKAIN